MRSQGMGSEGTRCEGGRYMDTNSEVLDLRVRVLSAKI